MELLFERFLSEERVANASNAADRMPDIDLDLPSGDAREEVIQHVYAKYGARGAAMTANVITYRPRMAVRDAGRALGLLRGAARPHRQAPARLDPSTTARRSPSYFEMAGFSRARAAHAPGWRAVATELLNLPRHLGQHSGGMVIAAGRLDEVVPLEPASMPGRVVVQWDKDDCADLGIVKVDLLGLGMMAVLAGRGAADPRATKASTIDYAQLPARRSQGLRACCAPPTRSACSRSSRARRWRRCRA